MSPARCESIIDEKITFECIVDVGEERHFGTTTVKGTIKGFLPSRPSGRGVPITYMDEIQHDAVTADELDNFLMIINPAGGKWKITAVSVEQAEKIQAEQSSLLKALEK